MYSCVILIRTCISICIYVCTHIRVSFSRPKKSLRKCYRRHCSIRQAKKEGADPEEVKEAAKEAADSAEAAVEAAQAGQKAAQQGRILLALESVFYSELGEHLHLPPPPPPPPLPRICILRTHI